jgi:hypothetical protein
VLQALQTNELLTFNYSIANDERLYTREDLEYAIEEKMKSLRFQGLLAEQLSNYLNSIPGLTPKRIRTAMELFTVGTQAIMKNEWKPNSGVGFKQMKGYESHRRL